MLRSTYHPLSRALHWTVFGLILIGMPMGAVMVRREFDDLNDVLYTLHWSIGLTVLLLMTVRLAVRLVVGAPRPAAILTPVQRVLSQTVHAGLYVALFTVAVLGWLGKSAYGAEPEGISVFYLFHVPVLLERNRELGETLLGYHGLAVQVFLALLALHIAGAVYHGLIARDGVVGRMGLGVRVAEPES